MNSSTDTSRTGMSRRSFLRRASSGAAAGAVCGLFSIGRARASRPGRTIMLGFDGMEPGMVEEMMAQGKLPHLSRLKDIGAATRLETTIPPQSPVAWTSFATCKNPGGHNIFDFIRRNPAAPLGPLPVVGTGNLEPPTLLPDGRQTRPARAIGFRTGIPFWQVADDSGRRGKVLNVPFAFPPDPLRNGIMLSALGVPDLRGTTSTYYFLSDSLSREQLQENIGGGRRVALAFDGSGFAVFNAPGPRDSRYSFQSDQAHAVCPLRIHVDRKAHRGAVAADDKKIELVQGAWSDWLELRFALSPHVEVLGITRFFPAELGPHVRIYMACVQYHPDAPYTPYTTPEHYSRDLRERYGLYKTIGWEYDTHAVRQNDLSEDAFLDDVTATIAWRERLTLDEFEQNDFDYFISAWTAMDRVGHLFWRFIDPQHPAYVPEAPARFRNAVEYTYMRADEITGKIMQRLHDADVLFVFSDHGFGTWRTGFNLNAWLLENGYLAVSNPDQASAGFLQGIDWPKTRAYAVGLSSLYLNLSGRERAGIVPPDTAPALRQEIMGKLASVRDPGTGHPVFSRLYDREVYRGESEKEAPDISLGYASGYQNARQTSRGGVGGPLFEPITDKWSGEHAATDFQLCPGIFFSNVRLEKDAPHIQDIGVTALRRMNADIPSDYEGDALL